MVQSPSWEANWFAASQEIAHISRTQRFITVLTSVRHLSLSWARPIQSIYPHPTSWRSILILSTHLHLGLPSGLLPSGFHSKILYTTFSSPIHATCPAHLILLDFITRTLLGEEYKSFSSSLCSSLRPLPTLIGQHLRFSHCCWWCKSSGIWDFVVGQVVHDVLKWYSLLGLPNSEDEGSTDLQDIRKYLCNQEVSHPTRLASLTFNVQELGTVNCLVLHSRQKIEPKNAQLQ